MKNFSIQVMPSKFSAEQREKGTSAFVEPLQMADTEWLQREVESMKLLASEGQTRVLVLSSAAILWTQTMFEEAVELPAGLYAVQGQPILLVQERGTEISDDYLCFEDYVDACCGDVIWKDLEHSMDVQQAMPFVHSRVDAITARQKLSDRILMHWIEEGVYLESPGETVIGPDVRIGEGTIIEAGVRLEGKTTIGPNCFLGAGSRIVDSELGPQVRVYNSVIEESVMEEGSNIGPFGHLRPASHIGKNVHIGNFVEVKKATLHEGTKAGHLAYIGDAEVGKGVNISCGVIFANYDGKNKHKTIVGDGAFLGSNVNLVAPVIVEEEGFIAAGSTITDTVKKGALAVERAACRHIEGYVEKKREKGLL